MKLKPLSKKGAIELSMTTVVVIVLAMTMLILGLILIRNIFQGATSNVKSINDKVREQRNSLFLENNDQKIVVYLPDGLASVKQGDTFAVEFAVRNIDAVARKFDYTVTAEAGGNCPASTNPQNWIILGQKGTKDVQSGDVINEKIRLQPALSTPLCTARFKISVKDYADESFDVKIEPKGTFG